MLAADRHRRILDKLNREVSVSTQALIAELDVTPMTLWRDLKLLDDQGLLKRVRGGAMRIDVENEPRFEAKVASSQGIKERLAQYAVTHIVQPGNIISLEGGTTVAAIASRLTQPNLTVLTNSLPVLNTLSTLDCRPGIYGCGGLLREGSGTFIGREALSFFTRRRSDIFFMSATGIDAETGITDPNPQEIEVKQVMASNAKRVILLIDSSKFGKVSLMEVIPWKRIDMILSDKPLPAPIAKLGKQSRTKQLHMLQLSHS